MGLIATIGSLWGTGKTPGELEAENQRLDAELEASQEAKRQRDQAYLDYLDVEGFGDGSEQSALDRRIALEREHLSTQRLDTADIDASLDRAADEGLTEGAGNVTGFVGGVFGVFGKAIGAVLKGVPLWLWALALVGVFVYLGGGGFLSRKARKALAS